jgi:hypothetical protein
MGGGCSRDGVDKADSARRDAPTECDAHGKSVEFCRAALLLSFWLGAGDLADSAALVRATVQNLSSALPYEGRLEQPSMCWQRLSRTLIWLPKLHSDA